VWTKDEKDEGDVVGDAVGVGRKLGGSVSGNGAGRSARSYQREVRVSEAQEDEQPRSLQSCEPHE
jgi:hypothetical protein